ncbi:hypothetical protein DIPPA_21764, partial [Diplonema papillatum]
IWKHEKFADTAAVMSAVVRMTNELPLSQKERTAKAWFKNDWQSFVGKRPGAPMEELKTLWKQDFPTLQAALDALQALQVPEPSPSRSKTGKELYAGKYGDLQAFAKRCLGSAWNEDSSTAVTACLTSIWKEQFSDLAAAEAEARARLQAVVADDIGDESVDECAAMEGAEHIDEGATKVDEEVVDAETDDTSTADTVAEPPKKRRKMVADIQALLRAQNLATTGTRAELESRLAQATGDVPSGDQEARFEARVIDHGWALVESPKRLFLESLESQGFTIDLATTTTTQYNMSCSYVTLYVASALQRNQCGPAHLPTVLQLQQFWRDVATPSMLHMTKARHSAVTDALTSEIFLGLTTNEVAAFCSHHKMRYISRGQHETFAEHVSGWRHVLSRRLVVDGWLHVTYASVVLGAARLSQIAAERVAAAKLGDTVVPSIVVRDPNQLRDEVAGARKIVTDEALSSQLYNMHMAELVCLLNGGSRQQALHNIRVLDLVGQMRPQKYTTDHHLHEMMGVWADLMRVKIACELQSNNASSLVIVLDGTNVKGMRKTEIYSVVARFFSRRLMAVDELPLGVFSFSDGDTSTGRVLYESVAQKLGDAGVHVARVTAVVSDKAANLSGHQTGLLGRLKSYANPKCVHLPDASHVLETAVGKAVTDTVMEKLPAIVEQTETHYRSSWKLTGLLLDFANQLGKPALSPATYMRLRWLPKVKQLLDRGVKMWPTWLQHMQDHPLLSENILRLQEDPLVAIYSGTQPILSLCSLGFPLEARRLALVRSALPRIRRASASAGDAAQKAELESEAAHYESAIIELADRGSAGKVRTHLKQLRSLWEAMGSTERGVEIEVENRLLLQKLRVLRTELERESRKLRRHDSMMDFMRASISHRDARAAQQREVLLREMSALRDQLFRAVDLRQTTADGVAFPLQLSDPTEPVEGLHEILLREREHEAELTDKLREDHTAQLAVLQLQLDEEIIYREKVLRDAEAMAIRESEKYRQELLDLKDNHAALLEHVEQHWSEKVHQLAEQLAASHDEIHIERSKSAALEARLSDCEQDLETKAGDISEMLHKKHLLMNVVHKLQSSIDHVRTSKGVSINEWATELETELRSGTDHATDAEIVHHKLEMERRVSDFVALNQQLRDASKKVEENEGSLADAQRKAVDLEARSEGLQRELLSAKEVVLASQRQAAPPRTFALTKVEILRRVRETCETHIRVDYDEFRSEVVFSTSRLVLALSREVGLRAALCGKSPSDASFIESQAWDKPAAPPSRACYASWLRVLLCKAIRDRALTLREKHSITALRSITHVITEGCLAERVRLNSQPPSPVHLSRLSRGHRNRKSRTSIVPPPSAAKRSSRSFSKRASGIA